MVPAMFSPISQPDQAFISVKSPGYIVTIVIIVTTKTWVAKVIKSHVIQPMGYEWDMNGILPDGFLNGIRKNLRFPLPSPAASFAIGPHERNRPPPAASAVGQFPPATRNAPNELPGQWMLVTPVILGNHG